MELRGGFRFVPAGQDEPETNLPQPVRGSKAKGTEPINQPIKDEKYYGNFSKPHSASQSARQGCRQEMVRSASDSGFCYMIKYRQTI